MTHTQSIVVTLFLNIIFACFHAQTLQCMNVDESLQKKMDAQQKSSLPLSGPKHNISLVHTVDILAEDYHRHGPVRHICTAPGKPNRLVIGMDSGYIKVVDFSPDFRTHTIARFFDPFAPHKFFYGLSVLSDDTIEVGFRKHFDYIVAAFPNNSYQSTETRYKSFQDAPRASSCITGCPVMNCSTPKKFLDANDNLVSSINDKSLQLTTLPQRLGNDRWAIGDIRGNIHIYELQKDILIRKIRARSTKERQLLLNLLSANE